MSTTRSLAGDLGKDVRYKVTKHPGLQKFWDSFTGDAECIVILDIAPLTPQPPPPPGQPAKETPSGVGLRITMVEWDDPTAKRKLLFRGFTSVGKMVEGHIIVKGSEEPGRVVQITR